MSSAALVDDLGRAVRSHQAGDLEHAERCYREILAAERDQPDALNLLGVLCAQSGRPEEAVMLLERSLRAKPENIAARYNLANTLRESGRARTALRHYRTVLKSRPDHASAARNMAAAYVDLGRTRDAIATYQRLLEQRPDDAAAMKSLGQVLWEAGDRGEAIEWLERTVAATPDDAEAWNLLGFMRFSSEADDEAAAAWRQAAAIEPRNPEHHHNLGQALRRLERAVEAHEAFAAAYFLEPERDRYLLRMIETAAGAESLGVLVELIAERFGASPQIHHQLADALREAGWLELAAAEYERALSLRPDMAGTLSNLSATLRALGRTTEAIDAAQRAVEHDPNLHQAWNNLASAHLDRRELRKAMDAATRALDLQNDSLDAHVTLAAAYRLGGRQDDSIEQLRALVQCRPDSADAHTRLGHALREAGRFDESREAYDRAGELAPDAVEATVGRIKILLNEGDVERGLEEMRPIIERSPHHPYVCATAAELAIKVRRYDEAIDRLLPIVDDQRHPLHERRTIAFRLGEAHDKAGRYEEAFTWYERANGMIDVPYDHETTVSAFQAIMAHFDAAFIEMRRSAGDLSERPIFIGGMPRSGTTLVEQILASHPQVGAAGELGLLGDIAAELPAMCRVEATYPACLDGAPESVFRAAGAACASRLQSIAPERNRTTEKTPTNFIHLGLIAIMCPRARLVYCERDPLDTCLSCYFHDFAGNYPYTYDLTHLGRFYSLHERMMRHWRDVLGERLLSVRYEDVVNDLEGQSRRLLEFCGLDWNDRVLEFHENRRVVLTASRDQVRTPIYASSVGRWKNYADRLGPLKAALGAS